MYSQVNASGIRADSEHGVPVAFSDGAHLDPFSRVRSSFPAMLWENKSLYDTDAHSWQEVTSGTSSAVTYRTNESSTRLTADTGATDYAKRQTKKYFPYVAGHGQTMFITFNMIAAPTANCVKRIGRFDDNNGPFLEWNENDIRVVVRTNTSGSVSDSAYVTQANWNLDTLDGSGGVSNPSKINLDLTKVQILVIDYQWLGVGRVRFGFDIEGHLIYFHEVNHANLDTIVYMQTPNLPVRYEVSNVGATSGTNSLDAICSSVISEGGLEPTGHDYSVSTGITAVTATSNVRTPILAIRQNPSFKGKVNRKIALAESFSIIAETTSIYFEVTQYPEPDITITGGWQNLDLNHSTLQYAIGTNISVNSETGAHPFRKGYIAASLNPVVGTPGTNEPNVRIRTHHNEMLVNYDGSDCETLVVWAAGLGANASVHAAANCIEYF